MLASAALVAIAALLAAMPRAAADDHPRTNRKIQTNGGDFESRRLQQKRGNDDIQRRVRGNNVFDRSSPDQSKKKRHRRKRRSKKAKTRKKDKKRDRKITKSSLSSSSAAASSGLKGRDGQCQTMTIYRRKEDLIEGVTYFGDLTDGEPGDNVIITIPFYNSEVGGEDAMGDIVQDWTWNVNGDGIGDMVFNFNSASGGGQVFTSFTLDCTAGGSTNPITGGT